MTETRWLDEVEQQTWRTFVHAIQLFREGLDRQLKQDSGMPHAYYMILAMLSEAPERSMTMTELARIVSSSPSRLSHAMARLEERGWVCRSRHPQDSRTTIATLTDDGFVSLSAAAPGHVEQVRRGLFDPLTPEQLTQLRDIFTAVLRAHGADAEPAAGRRA